MFLLALLGYQALASTWKGEYAMESNDLFDAIGWLFKRIFGWRATHFDENQFLDDVERRLGRAFQTRQFTRTKVDGGVWVRGRADELVLSAYMHPSKYHSVGVRSGATAKILPEKVDSVPPGVWAIAFGHPGSASGNEALYKIDE